MECKDDAAVERQKLVDDGEIENEPEDEPTTLKNLAKRVPKSNKPHNSPKLSNKVFTNSEATIVKQDLNTCSMARGNAETTRLIFMNERDRDRDRDRKQTETIKSDIITKVKKNNRVEVENNLDVSFETRSLKHHSFVSEVPDIRHMERALLGLLDDFHSGKLKAFGCGCTMEQMTDIREQQEGLAKLHFEFEPNGGQFNNSNDITAQENMVRLVQKLENLSVSIEKLHSTNSNL